MFSLISLYFQFILIQAILLSSMIAFVSAAPEPHGGGGGGGGGRNYQLKDIQSIVK